jgi:hypothetical protein
VAVETRRKHNRDEVTKQSDQKTTQFGIHPSIHPSPDHQKRSTRHSTAQRSASHRVALTRSLASATQLD